MLKLSTAQILENLKSEKEFFISFQQDFKEIFSKNIALAKPGLMSISALQTFGIKLFALLFSFDKDPTDELYAFSKKLAQNDINLKPVIIKSLLNSIGKFAIYLSNKEESLEKLKNLIALIDIHLSVIDKAYMDYLEEIKTSLKSKEEEQNEIVLSLLEKIKNRSDEVEIIDFYKELPIVLKSKILKMFDEKIILSIYGGKYNYLKKEENIYLKHPYFPKPIKANIYDLDPKNETLTIYNFMFSEIEQDKRKYVRVQPKDRIEIKLSFFGKTYFGYIKDISLGGVGVYIENIQNLKIGQEVGVHFLLSTGEVKTKGIIKHISKIKNFNILGLEYHYNLDIKTEEIISSYITQRQFEILKELKGK